MHRVLEPITAGIFFEICRHLNDLLMGSNSGFPILLTLAGDGESLQSMKKFHM
ncbi:hypothetical protein [Gimesia aquarii]|uniref:Uncharacterized protein n=1 Tax=Gimesia aquarii TaxID=2527964 RepID=A0A517WSQ0_9PLAN|nr:hypothetical protein [Gimesia aquarii]QDU08271.1 hypothetical protein V202x_16370 [Gimesia aquarii]